MAGRVLLLDDDTQFCASLSRALERVGLRVSSVSRGVDATEYLRSSDPDVVVVDGLLPDTDGVTWIEALREGGDDRTLVFVSAFYRDLGTFRHLTRDLAVARVYHKPLTIDRFVRELVELIPHPKTDSPPRLRLVTPNDIDNVIYPDEVDERRAAKLADLEMKRESLPQQVDDFRRSIDRVRSDSERPSLLDDALRQIDHLQQAGEVLDDLSIASAASDVEQQLRRLRDAGTVNWDTVSDSVVLLERNAKSSGRRVTAAPPPTVTSAAARLLTHHSPESVVPTLLVLEDDPAMVAYLRAAFEDLLIHVRTTHTAEEALQIVAESHPTAALVGWPLEDGSAVIDFLAEFRGRDSSRSCKVIMLSVNDSMSLRRKAATWGVDYFISQPIDLSRLRYAVELAMLSVPHHDPAVLVLGDESAVEQLEGDGLTVHRASDVDEAATILQVHDVPVVLLGSSSSEVTVPAVLRMTCWDSDFAIAAFDGAPASKAREVDRVWRRDENWLPLMRRLAERVLSRRRRSIRCSATGLLQRASGLGAIESGLAYAQRHGRSYGAAMLCPLGLESVNANIQHGIKARLGRGLSARFRKEDARIRWDRNTFLVGIEGPDTRALSDVVRRFQDEVAIQLRQDGYDYEGFRLAAGLATYPIDGDTVRSLVLTSYERLQENSK